MTDSDHIDTDVPPVFLQKLNEAMYIKNAELATRNKTLTILRHLSTQSLQFFGVNEVCQSMVNTLTDELGVIFALISLYDDKTDTVGHKAITQSKTVTDAFTLFSQPLTLHVIHASHTDNIIMKTIKEIHQQEGKNLFDMFQPYATKEECSHVEKQLSMSEYYTIPIIFNSKPIGCLTLGLSKPMNQLSTAERESIDQIVPVVALAIDRTQLYEETLRYNEKLLELDKLKDEFVSITSHELRTPMTAIKGYLWLMLKKKDTLSPDMVEKLKRIYSSSERMLALVNDMLDVSRIESGRMQMVFENFDISQIMNDVYNDLEGHAEDLGIQLHMDISKPYKVYADPNRIHEVLTNFVGNAIKFTARGGMVNVTVTDEHEYVVISVTDTGIGIAADDMKKLFTKYGRLDTNNSAASQMAGTGLGLYICKKIIDLSGGTIRVESEIGKGSTFTFTLPKEKKNT